MKTRAAILWEPHTDWSVEDIELDPPKRGEILVKLAASGLCHSDEHMVTGDMVLDPELAEAFGLKQFPVIGGHEGAGVVEEVGPDTVGFEVGDHVVFSFIPSCGRCPSCSTGHQHLCDLGAFLLSGMQLSDFSYRHHGKDGKDLFVMAKGGGQDVVTDFKPGTDQVKLEGYSFADFTAVKAAMTASGGSVVLKLGGGETRKFPVVFVVDPKLPKDVNTITLSYTFFEVAGRSAAASADREDRGG